jgi:hypothetical protein
MANMLLILLLALDLDATNLVLALHGATLFRSTPLRQLKLLRGVD